MGKIVISARRKTVSNTPKKKQKVELKLEDFEGLVKESKPLEYLSNPENISKAFLECLLNNDPDGAMEMIEIHLEALNKAKLSRKTKLAKSTLYSSLKHRNPTIKTLAKIMYASSH